MNPSIENLSPEQVTELEKLAASRAAEVERMLGTLGWQYFEEEILRQVSSHTNKLIFENDPSAITLQQALIRSYRDCLRVAYSIAELSKASRSKPISDEPQDA